MTANLYSDMGWKGIVLLCSYVSCDVLVCFISRCNGRELRKGDGVATKRILLCETESAVPLESRIKGCLKSRRVNHSQVKQSTSLTVFTMFKLLSFAALVMLVSSSAVMAVPGGGPGAQCMSS